MIARHDHGRLLPGRRTPPHCPQRRLQVALGFTAVQSVPTFVPLDAITPAVAEGSTHERMPSSGPWWVSFASIPTGLVRGHHAAFCLSEALQSQLPRRAPQAEFSEDALSQKPNQSSRSVPRAAQWAAQSIWSHGCTCAWDMRSDSSSRKLACCVILARAASAPAASFTALRSRAKQEHKSGSEEGGGEVAHLDVGQRATEAGIVPDVETAAAAGEKPGGEFGTGRLAVEAFEAPVGTNAGRWMVPSAC